MDKGLECFLIAFGKDDTMRNTRVNLILMVFLFFIFLFPIPVAFSQEKRVYSIGVVPQFAPIAILKKWNPFVEYLSSETGFAFELDTSESIPEFEKEFLKGKFDFAFMNPYHEVKAKEQQGYLPIVYDKSKKLVGILVVRKDDPIKAVNELDGKKIAFPSPNAFGASQYMRALLAERENITIIPHYVKTHDNVYRNVILGRTVAGGGVNKTLKRQPVEIQEQLRIFYETPGVTSHPFSVHPRVPDKVRDAVVDAILKLYEQDEGKEILIRVSLTQPVKADYQKDYGYLENLNLEQY